MSTSPADRTIAELEAGKRVCLYSPTGGGKTEQAVQLLKWAESNGLGGCFYVNRKLLVGQTADRFRAAGLNYGIRAADYEDRYDFYAPFQVCSADTERSRVFERELWPLHDAGIVIVDEGHLQKTQTMKRILAEYRSRGAHIVLLTATPVGMREWADTLVVSGSMKEYRDCGALVLARVFSFAQPDLAKVKRNPTGEYVMDGKKKKVYTQSIVGDVMEGWKRHNPDARPTMLYAPGKPESVYLTARFQDMGVNWCHVDATDAIVGGKRAKLTRALWQEILERYIDNDIKGLSCRFKLREGIDVPSTYHCILATPIGSLASYLQTVGRVLRRSPETPDEVIVTDHGGCFHRHGSPNMDRPWGVLWDLPEHEASSYYLNAIKEGKIDEPIRCPSCGGERPKGPKCPHCGHMHEKSKREVIMESGELREVTGKMIHRRRRVLRHDTEKLWARMYFGWKRKGIKKSFKQMEAFFFHEHGYHPPRSIPFMPKAESDMHKRICDVDPRDLHPGRTQVSEKAAPKSAGAMGAKLLV